MQPQPVPDGENAAVVYRQAFAALVNWKESKTNPVNATRSPAFT